MVNQQNLNSNNIHALQQSLNQAQLQQQIPFQIQQPTPNTAQQLDIIHTQNNSLTLLKQQN